MRPFAMTGGLADVAGALPQALGKLGLEVCVVMPRYRGIRGGKKKLSENVTAHFVENEEFFNRASLYGDKSGDYPDNLKRFAFFSRAALDLCKRIDFKPDVVHANDWQSALVPVYLRTLFADDPFFKKTRSLLTVHNLAYQGLFPHRFYNELGLDHALYNVDAFEFYGRINLLKGGLVFADSISTVSPTYAEEIRTKEFGYGLEGVVEQRKDRLRGILNGLDYKLWNPKADKKIEKNFAPEGLSGKAVNKKALQRSCGLEEREDVPVFSIVSRLAEQKGVDLLSEVADVFLSKKLQFVLLGNGDAVYETAFRNIGARHPKNASVSLKFDAERAHLIYAGSDFFLMPSLYEPCGLGQLISLRYGTLPVVRKTGGLRDTISDADAGPKKGNGFVYSKQDAKSFLGAVDRALAAFEDKRRLAALRKHAMKRDFSWEHSAKEYARFYKEIKNL